MTGKKTIITPKERGKSKGFLGTLPLLVLVIEDAQPVVSSNIFTRVTSASQLVAGKRYILVYEGDQEHDPAAMGAINPSGTSSGISVTGSANFAYDNDNSVIQLTEGTGVKVLTLGGTSGAWTLALDGALLNHTGDK